jgi:cytochrome c2
MTYYRGMAAFSTVHPTERGDEVFAHCGICHYFEPLGVGLNCTDDVLEEFLSSWDERHYCEAVSETGRMLFGES